LIGMPMLVAGTVAFALSVLRYAPVGALIPVLAVVVLAEVVAAREARRGRAEVLTAFFAGFAGLWLTYAVLLLGLDHKWFGITPQDTVRAVVLFMASWLVVIVLLGVASLELSAAFTLILLLQAVALVLLLVGTIRVSAGLLTAAGGVLVVLLAVAAYASIGTIGPVAIRRALPLGPALLAPRPDDSVVPRAPLVVKDLHPAQNRHYTSGSSGPSVLNGVLTPDGDPPPA
jgi:succinate-acetate transporter protein